MHNLSFLCSSLGFESYAVGYLPSASRVVRNYCVSNRSVRLLMNSVCGDQTTVHQAPSVRHLGLRLTRIPDLSVEVKQHEHSDPCGQFCHLRIPFLSKLQVILPVCSICPARPGTSSSSFHMCSYDVNRCVQCWTKTCCLYTGAGRVVQYGNGLKSNRPSQVRYRTTRP